MRLFTTLLIFLTLLSAEEVREYKGIGIHLELICDHESVRKGKDVTYGLVVTHDEGYHSYWKNPGIIGYPLTLEWNLPEEIKSPIVEYPYPELVKMSLYPCYGYERTITILSTFSIPEGYSLEAVTGALKVRWMCCADSCCPDQTSFPLNLPIGESIQTEQAVKLENAKAELPLLEHTLTAKVSSKPDSESITVELTLPKGSTPVYLFTEDNQSSSDIEQLFILSSKGESTYSIELPRYKYSPAEPTHFPFVLQTTTAYYSLSPAYPLE